MSCCDDRAWLQARLEKTEALIEAYEEAIFAVSAGGAGGAFSYTLDTGQTRVTVTRSTLGEARNMLSSLENRRAVLRAQLGCGGSGNIGPAF